MLQYQKPVLNLNQIIMAKTLLNGVFTRMSGLFFYATCAFALALYLNLIEVYADFSSAETESGTTIAKNYNTIIYKNL